MSETKIYNCCISSDMLETFIALNYVRLTTVGRSAIEKGPDVYLSKPGAIDLGKRLLEHFDVLPTKPELHCVILALDSFMDVCEEYGAMMPGTENRTKIDATIAKLRRLVGEG